MDDNIITIISIVFAGIIAIITLILAFYTYHMSIIFKIKEQDNKYNDLYLDYLTCLNNYNLLKIEYQNLKFKNKVNSFNTNNSNVIL